MDIHFNCPHCGQHLSVEGRGAGITVNCPACKGEIEIPRDSTPPPLPKLSVPTKPSQKKARHNWRDDPATQSQKDCLKRMGITINEGLTKGEASDLIGGAKAEPLYSETQQKIREAKCEEQCRIRAQYPSYHLKQAIASATKDLEETKKEKREAKALLGKKNRKLAAAQQKRVSATDEFEQMTLDQEIPELEFEVGEAEEAFDSIDVEEAKDEMRYQSRLRIKFWKATFPSGSRSVTMEDWEGLADYNETIGRYSEFGCRFKVPTDKQISDVLAALDRDAPAWDKTEPERFYSALSAAFPDLARKEHGHQYAVPRGVGCLVVIIGATTIVWYLLRHFS